MRNYLKRSIIVIAAVLVLACLSFAEERSGATATESGAPEVHMETGELATPRGNVRTGMSIEELYDIFRESDRILIPEGILNRGCHVFRDITSNNPNDTITFFVKGGRVAGWHKGYVASCQNLNSIYEYDNNTHIDVWFFPKDKAKWDGTKVNLLDWNELSQAQKIMFIKEYLQQLNQQNNTNIYVDIDKYILGMNYYSSNCPIECTRISASAAVNNLLVKDGKASKAN